MQKDIRRYLNIGLVLIFGSCSSTTSQQSSNSDDLVNTFDIPAKNLDKFKVEVVAPEPVEPVTPDVSKVSNKNTEVMPAPVIDNSDKMKTKPKIINKASKSKEKKVAVVVKPQNEVSPTPTPMPSPAVETITYPAGVPEEYRAFDKKSKEIWNSFALRLEVGESFTLAIKYMGIVAGNVTITTGPLVRVAGKTAHHITARVQSSKKFSYIYTLDDRLESFVEKDTFIPVKYQLIQRESSQDVDDLQLFSAEEMKTFFYYRRLKKGVEKKSEEEGFTPKYFQDSFSALYFVRGLPLRAGDVYEVPIVGKTKLSILRAEVVGVETIEVRDQMVEAIKIKADTSFPGVLKKTGDIIFWYANDAKRGLLKFSAKVKIGSIEGELI